MPVVTRLMLEEPPWKRGGGSVPQTGCEILVLTSRPLVADLRTPIRFEQGLARSSRDTWPTRRGLGVDVDMDALMDWLVPT